MKVTLMPDLQHIADTSFEKKFYIPNDGTKNDFKKVLVNYWEDVKNLDSLLPEIKNLNQEEISLIYKDLKHFSSAFDKLHEKYYDEKYLGDKELKVLLNDIDEQLHKLEKVSHKYYTKYLPVEKTPDYIKSGLAEYSQGVLSNKLA